MRSMLAIAAFALSATAGTSVALGQDCSPETDRLAKAHTYSIRASGVGEGGRTHALTGFRVKNHSGVFTALHGILGAQAIEAELPSGDELPVPLQVYRVDRAADVAQLVPMDVQLADVSAGLEIAAAPLLSDPVCISGFPYDRPEIATRELRVSTSAKLGRLIGLQGGMPAFTSFLIDAGSPSLEFKMLDVDGAIVPGLSGAPLLDQAGQVVGIANGGLVGGGTNFTWAAPVDEICMFSENRICQTIDEVEVALLDARERYGDRLKEAGLFDIATARVPLVTPAMIRKADTGGAVGTHRSVETVVDLISCARAEIETRVQNNDYVYGFCVSPLVRFIGRSANENFEHEGSRFCTVSRFEIEAATVARDLLGEEPELIQIFEVSEDQLQALARYDPSDIEQRRSTSIDLPAHFCAPRSNVDEEHRAPGIYEVEIVHQVGQKEVGLQDSLHIVAEGLRDVARLKRDLEPVLLIFKDLLSP